MHSKILLGKILQRFADCKVAQVKGYKSFGYIKETNNAVILSRENGVDTPVPFGKIELGIEAYKSNTTLYNEGPTVLREFNIKYITSPVFALLHLLSIEDYE